VGALALEAQQLPQRAARGIRAEFFLAAAELHEVFARQVDASGRVILLHVLPVLDELQTRADRIGLADALGSRRAEDVEHEFAHAVCGEVAVVEQLLVVLAAVLDLIEPVGVDQSVEGPDRQLAFSDRGHQRLDDRVPHARVHSRFGTNASVHLRLSVDASVPVRLGVDTSVPAFLDVDTGVDLSLQFVEHREAVAVRGVADLVCEPREAVDRHQVTALLGGENAQRHGKVLRGGASGDDIRRELEPIGFEHVERASVHGAPASAVRPDRRCSR